MRGLLICQVRQVVKNKRTGSSICQEPTTQPISKPDQLHHWYGADALPASMLAEQYSPAILQGFAYFKNILAGRPRSWYPLVRVIHLVYWVRAYPSSHSSIASIASRAVLTNSSKSLLGSCTTADIRSVTEGVINIINRQLKRP